jgi:hypothetical protein
MLLLPSKLKKIIMLQCNKFTPLNIKMQENFVAMQYICQISGVFLAKIPAGVIHTGIF